MSVMVWIVGAVCVDLVAARRLFIEGTSNPSSIHFAIGGVGYRIFRDCAAPKRFITALGADPFSAIARETLRDNPSAIVKDRAECGPAVYLAFMEDGRLKLGASDLTAVEKGLDVEFVAGCIGAAGPKDFIVFDGNLSADLTRGLAGLYAGKTRLVFEPVSVEKALKHRSSLRSCWLTTPSVEEAIALVRGVEEGAPLSDAEIFSYLEEMGIKRFIVTRGAEGLSLYAGDARVDFTPARRVEASDTNGAGDLFVSALLGFLHEGAGLPGSIRASMNLVEDALEKGAL